MRFLTNRCGRNTDDTRRLLSTDQEAVVLLAAEKGSVERT